MAIQLDEEYGFSLKNLAAHEYSQNIAKEVLVFFSYFNLEIEYSFLKWINFIFYGSSKFVTYNGVI